jgi:hypothetical protein
MFSVFSNKYKFQYGRDMDSSLINLRRWYQEDYGIFKDYYYNRDIYLENNNLLFLMIKNMYEDIPSVYDFVSIMEAKIERIVRTYGIVTNYNNGKANENILLPKGNNELLLLVNGDINFDISLTNFRDYSYLEVVYQDSDDISVIPIGESGYEVGDSLIVYEIDLINLLLQYRTWANIRVNNEMSTDIGFFINSIVRPNTLASFIDHAVLNRFFTIMTGGKGSKATPNIVSPATNINSKLDRALKYSIKSLKDSRKPIDQIIDNIPTLFSDSMSDRLKLTQTYYNRQSEWGLYTARLIYINSLLLLMGEKGIMFNKAYINELRIRLEESNNLLDRFESLGDYYSMYMKHIIESIFILTKGG